jgi:hypothetical protein
MDVRETAMRKQIIVAAAVGVLSAASVIGSVRPGSCETKETSATTAAACRPRSVPVEALGKQLVLRVPGEWTETAMRETTGPTDRVHYDWKCAAQNVTLTFVAVDPPRVLREVLHPTDDASLVRKMVIATFRLNDIDVMNLVVALAAGRPNAYDVTCTTTVRSRAKDTYPRPHTLSTTMSRPLPVFHSRADVRSTSGSYMNRMAVVVVGRNVYMACAAAKVDGVGTEAAAGALNGPIVTSFLTSLSKPAF